jgi:AcrR family transcriptional regulator
MAKKKPERRADVLNEMANYLLGSGMSDATLRPAAAAIGTSTRTLLYHFRSKEDLLVEALKEVRRREVAMLAQELAELPRGSVSEVMRAIWRWYSSPARTPYLKLFFEAWGVSLHRPFLYEGFLRDVKRDLVDVMVPVIEGYGYPPHQAAAIATFFVAAFRGLLIDLVANEEDSRRLDDAMEIFIGNTEVMMVEGPNVAARALGETPAEAARRRSGRRRN